MESNCNALRNSSTCRKRLSLATAATINSSLDSQTLRHSFSPFLYTQLMKLKKTELRVFMLNSHNYTAELLTFSKKYCPAENRLYYTFMQHPAPSVEFQIG